MSMRSRFYALAGEALEDDTRVALVTAEIGVGELPAHPRHFNVGIREQLMIGVAAGLALEGMRPVAHSYTPFLVERPYEQVKLDLGHQDLRHALSNAGDGVQALERLSKRAHAFCNLAAHASDAFVERVNVAQLLGEQEALVGLHSARQCSLQQAALCAHLASGQLRHGRDVGRAVDQCVEHVPTRESERVRSY